MIRRTALSLAAVAALAGCGGASSDKAGGKHGDVRVLRLANANEETFELEPFAHEVKRLSGGRLRIEFVNSYRRSGSDAEPLIIDDVRAGKVDLAWVGARAFKAEGVDALDPLIAPFEVTDYATEQAVLEAPVGRAMLDGVEAAGVHGVAILPGPMRRLGMREAWSGPDDLNGKRIGSSAGIALEAFKALGATPVVGGGDSRLEGLDGDEEHLTAFLGNYYMHEIPHVATQPLWPRPLVVIAAPKLWDSLTPEQRRALTEAGTSAVRPTLDRINDLEREAIPKLCSAGAQFFDADIDALRAAVHSVRDRLATGSGTRKSYEAIEALQSGNTEPIACPAARTKTKGGLPAGEYTWTLTEADKRRRKAGHDWDEALPEVFRAVITPGHLVMYITEHGEPEVLGFEEDFSTFKDRIVIDKFSARWKVTRDGDLVFSDVTPKDSGDDFVFATKPWRRVR